MAFGTIWAWHLTPKANEQEVAKKKGWFFEVDLQEDWPIPLKGPVTLSAGRKSDTESEICTKVQDTVIALSTSSVEDLSYIAVKF